MAKSKLVLKASLCFECIRKRTVGRSSNSTLIRVADASAARVVMAQKRRIPFFKPTVGVGPKADDWLWS
ncbi:hypothetical protein GTA62_21200 [Roseobacter sp. HKCCD9010]|uniref:hypothetical protein n=1 Tax=unclassified Roseobacter TaxID=196798 RepID=UPI0014929D11|nr:MULTISPECIES: hypothetical protein [unclassified Roseobacter]MBF9052527.1 hypothetical protein [Rhodobacterales bacterium HKCCD4356]NNV36710.1 hypothetical protein [Roseobacter sp. HKCCD9073]NNV70763.1 hypothetical protein [Roseobacter sp. HKCCD8474]NNV92050.1 hypothetical protein [Roseobacter sp. HKCCD9020]NNW68761.1 hypothetical protein [Roseobacter sp. HKCCD8473]NNX02830.1 hypothetical protein [Roseobacter sp. HKCCD9036]NNZ07305.1 hypothetical protein [Roseobacter sp. HKCCD7415]NNZ242